MYLKEDIDKLGNTIIFLSERIDDLSKTKLLKILYILDEFSIKEFGIPFLNLRYEVWQYGPVAQDIFIDLSNDEPEILKDYIYVERDENKTYIKAKAGFNDDEFSSSELDFLKNVVETVKLQPAYVLVDFTHKTDSLWYNAASKNNLLEAFKQGMNSSNVEIDFKDILKDEPEKLNRYLHHIALDKSLRPFKI